MSNTAPRGYGQPSVPLKRAPCRCWARAARCLTPLCGLQLPPRRRLPTLVQRQLQSGVAKTWGATSAAANFIVTFVGNNRTAVVSAPLCWGLFTGFVLEREQGKTACPAQRWQQHGRGTPMLGFEEGVLYFTI